MTTTPPPPGRIRTPPTPFAGADQDDFEPYSPRRSTRVSSKRSQDQTSPQSTLSQKPGDAPFKSTIPSILTPRSRKRTFTRQISSQTLSPPSSPEISPRRQRNTHSTTTRQLSSDHQWGDRSGETNLSGIEAEHNPADMLPTPRKTPRKRDSPLTSRVLNFNSQNVTGLHSTPSKRRQRLTLDSPDISVEAGIQVFTDSQDRIPELEMSDDNPFVGTAESRRSQAAPQRRSTRLNKEEREMAKAVKRNEGIIFTFRGRKIFRKFTEEEDGEDADDTPQHVLSGQSARIRHMAGPSAQRPITRSSLKPRLLFQQPPMIEEDEEEAITDIEEGVSRSDVSDAAIGAQVEADVAEAMAAPKKGKKASPFDSWPRQKAASSRQISQGVKRAAPAADEEGGVGKRTRSSAHAA